MNAPRQRQPVVIRPFQVGDEPALHAVFYSAVHEIAAARYTPEQLNAWAPADYDVMQWAERLRRNQPFLAEIDGQPVGYTDLQADGHIDHFFVAGTHVRQGVGRQLMDHLLKLAVQRGLSRVQAHVSLSAEPFFLRNGFAVTARQTVTVRGVSLANALMTRMQL